jgi:UDP-N-acetylmuramate dehydrogenase
MSFLAEEFGVASQMTAFGATWLPAQPMREHTSLGVGGPADMARVRDHRRLPELMEYFQRRHVPWRVLGGGTNLLVSDEGLPEVLVHLARGEGLTFSENRVEVPAAMNLATAVTECAKRNLGGMEGLVGVPGTVGGAVRMNAGAYGNEIGDVVRALMVYRGSTGQIETVKTNNVRFEYRHASFAPDDIVLSVSLELPERPYPEILERIRQCNQKRRASQPIDEKSAGCVFKNPPGHSAGKMIDELGLKGTRVGGAVVSERHANFLVNRYNATATDFLRLMDLIRGRVLKTYGVQLEEEVIVWR